MQGPLTNNSASWKVESVCNSFTTKMFITNMCPLQGCLLQSFTLVTRRIQHTSLISHLSYILILEYCVVI